MTFYSNGAQTQTRTGDTRIFSPLLYQLSYLGIFINRFVIDIMLSITNKFVKYALLKILLSIDLMFEKF